jgi:hypothetical protein
MGKMDLEKIYAQLKTKGPYDYLTTICLTTPIRSRAGRDDFPFDHHLPLPDGFWTSKPTIILP